jgi:uncharacterized protein YkwD
MSMPQGSPVALFIGALSLALLASPVHRAAGRPNPQEKPDADKDKGAFVLSKEEQEIIDLTNKERAKEKLPPLKANEKLFQAGRSHAANMAKHDKMEHVLDGKNPIDRVAATTYPYLYVGENVAWAFKKTPAEVMDQWMKSEPHRKNILDKRFTEIGIGIAPNDKGILYYTQVFGTPKPK